MQEFEDAVNKLISRTETIGIAESCTGGMIASNFTDIPGVSAIFVGGIVSYSNEMKNRFLGVHRRTLHIYGAVSSQCAQEMARGVRRVLATDWGIAVTGIAGPSGGTTDKPVGLVYIGIAGPSGTMVSKEHFSGDRNEVRTQTAQRAVTLLMEQIKKEELKCAKPNQN